MAQLPIEVVLVGESHVDELDAILALLNKLQDAFRFTTLTDDTAFQFQGASPDRYRIAEVYDLLDSVKRRIKGYHPHLVAIVDRRLDGKKLGNLLGSMKQDGADLQGMAIATLHQIPQLLDPVPEGLYIVFELLSFSIRFLHGEGLIHDEPRGCVFDRKIDKREISEAIKVGRFCPVCEQIVSGLVDADQELAIERVFRIIREVSNDNDPVNAWSRQLKARNPLARVFLCHSSRDKDFVRRVATSLVDHGCRVWFDAWEIRVGDNIVQKINDGLQESDFVAVVLSKSAMESEWVKNEWTAKFMTAADERRAMVLPLLIEQCEIPALLKPLKYADFRNRDKYDTALGDILNAVGVNVRIGE